VRMDWIISLSLLANPRRAHACCYCKVNELIKLDPAAFPELFSSVELISTTIFHAIGDHVPEDFRASSGSACGLSDSAAAHAEVVSELAARVVRGLGIAVISLGHSDRFTLHARPRSFDILALPTIMIEEPLVSVVTPVWRDDDALKGLLEALGTAPRAELIVAAALGDEARYYEHRAQRPDVRWVSAPRGRAVQMNAGASVARGRWLLFLHADSRLPLDWLRAVADADAREDVAAGTFTLRFDSTDWQARVIEYGVRIRVRLLGLPYGDQALFVRRTVFEAMGGYRDLPLMEDIDFVRRVRKAGRLLRCASPVVTSARRWKGEGWLRRSTRNLTLAARYFFGASPARLAQQYFDRKRSAVVMMARAPWTRGKTRLEAVATGEAHEALRSALFLDTLDVTLAIERAEHIVACDPPGDCERLRTFIGPTADVIAQRGTDLGSRLMHVFEDTFRLGVESIVVLGSDLPDLPSEMLENAFSALERHPDPLVLGPAADGGYYLIGMNRLHPELFEGIDWSTPRVLAQTLDTAKRHGLAPVLLGEWRDIDDPASLSNLLSDSRPPTAPRTRAWGDRWSRDDRPTDLPSVGKL
jgi:rSAM/selenodomain-associated transferase 2/rSAM/selenodomain-associated transferase 1